MAVARSGRHAAARGPSSKTAPGFAQRLEGATVQGVVGYENGRQIQALGIARGQHGGRVTWIDDEGAVAVVQHPHAVVGEGG